jgi:catechol 2,3-dioxygenase-like lactoylglutathione lyase family enzyme
MLLDLNHIGQISLPVSDPDRSEAFYADVVGLKKLYRFGDLVFFDCAGVRLLLDKVRSDTVPPQGCIYFRCADIAVGRRARAAWRRDQVSAAPDRAHGRPRSVDGVLRGS